MTTTASQLMSEKLIGLSDVADKFPSARSGKPVSFSCVLRWITSGIKGPAGNRIRLEAIRLGGRWLTTEEALARWTDKLTPDLSVEKTENKKRRKANDH